MDRSTSRRRVVFLTLCRCTSILLLTAVLSGCGTGALLGAVIGIVLGSGGGDGAQVANAPATGRIVGVPRTPETVNEDQQRFRVRLLDRESNPASFRLEFKKADGGDFESVVIVEARRVDANQVVFADAGGATELVGLATSPQGVEYELLWDLQRTGVQGAMTGVTLRLTMLGAGGAPVGPPFALKEQSIGNEAPIVVIALPPALYEDGEREGTVAIPYELYDSSGDPIAVEVGYTPLRSNGTDLKPATGTTSTVSQTRGLLSQDPTDSSQPFRHTYVWESDRDPGAMWFQGAVRILITASDGIAAPTIASVTFAIDNNEPPEVDIVVTPALEPRSVGVKSPVTIEYVLFDLEGDPVRISAWYTIEQGDESWEGPFPATPASGPAGPVWLPATDTGTSYSFRWDHAADLADPTDNPEGLSARRVMFEIEPGDENGDVGATGTSTVFVVGNDPPVARITDVPQLGSGNVPIRYTLFDSSADLALIEVASSTNGVDFYPMTVDGQVAGLTTTAPDTPTLPAVHTRS
ncbi:hypothetical protein ACFL59_06725 [Planctomycetota bacterium]